MSSKLVPVCIFGFDKHATTLEISVLWIPPAGKVINKEHGVCSFLKLIILKRPCSLIFHLYTATIIGV